MRAMERLRERFPHALTLHLRADRGVVPTPAPAARSHGRSDHDITLDFVAELRGVAATDDEAALLRDAVDACCDDPEADVLLTGTAAPMRIHHLRIEAFGPFADRGHRRPRLPQRRRPVPAHRCHRCRQDQRARRDLLRPLRRGPRRPAGGQAAPLRPGRRRTRALGDAGVHRPGPAVPASTGPRRGSVPRSAASGSPRSSPRCWSASGSTASGGRWRPGSTRRATW